MFLQVLDFAMSLILVVFLAVFVFASAKRAKAVKGTHLRYVLSTARLAATIGIAVVFFCRGVVHMVLAEPVAAGVDAFAGIMYAWLAYRAYGEDDNWFNKQGKRLRRGIKRLRQRLANTAPLPLPSPT